MKQYGLNKATEFTKKQINVVYAKAKMGELNVEKWFISRLYDLADFYGTDFNRSIEQEEEGIKRILEEMFSGNIEEAQRLINIETENAYSRFTEKYRKSFDRSFVA